MNQGVRREYLIFLDSDASVSRDAEKKYAEQTVEHSFRIDFLQLALALLRYRDHNFPPSLPSSKHL